MVGAWPVPPDSGRPRLLRVRSDVYSKGEYLRNVVFRSTFCDQRPSSSFGPVTPAQAHLLRADAKTTWQLCRWMILQITQNIQAGHRAIARCFERYCFAECVGSCVGNSRFGIVTQLGTTLSKAVLPSVSFFGLRFQADVRGGTHQTLRRKSSVHFTTVINQACNNLGELIRSSRLRRPSATKSKACSPVGGSLV